MKTRFMALLAAIMALGTIPMIADEAKADTADSDKKPKVERKGDRPKREDFQNLTEEQKAEKIKERKAKAEARLKELKDKKAAGTLTERETKMLESMEARANRPAKPAKRQKPAAEEKAEK